ncbi:hypothetical protein [Paenibacillus terrigena]|nr:hypothetical protein [Paenibacillus terrigena]
MKFIAMSEKKEKIKGQPELANLLARCPNELGLQYAADRMQKWRAD